MSLNPSKATDARSLHSLMVPKRDPVKENDIANGNKAKRVNSIGMLVIGTLVLAAGIGIGAHTGFSHGLSAQALPWIATGGLIDLAGVAFLALSFKKSSPPPINKESS